MEDAFGAQGREAITKAREEYREVFGPMHEIMRKASDDLTNVLLHPKTRKPTMHQKRVAIDDQEA